MKKIIGCLLLSFLLVLPNFAKLKKTKFDEKSAMAIIKDLSANAMQGRKSGQPGGVLCEEYIAAWFKKNGLEPAGDNRTYFQNLTINHSNIKEGVTFEIRTEKSRRAFFYREDWRTLRYSGSGHFVAEIVFVGFGIHAPDKGYDDYDGVDVKEKWVLLRTGSPQKLADKLKEEAKMENRVKIAQKLGVRGILMSRSSSSQSRYFRMRLKKEIYKPDFVILYVDEKVTNFIFKELNTELRYLFRKIEKESKSHSLPLGVKAHVSVNAEFDEKRKTRNVLAKITGSHKQLKNECVVIGAHMDHLGITPMGDVMNGANDNASGTAVTMEIARVMKLNRIRPKRTVIFGLWAGEEQGLLGSEYYSEHPTIAMDKTIAYINMDMVGHGEGKATFSGEYYGPKIWAVLKEKLPKKILDYVKASRGGPGGSDHSPFLKKGVAGYSVWSEGTHLKYHRNRDDFDLIKPEIVKKIGDCVYAATIILAQEPQNFFQPKSEETFHLKYQTLINFKTNYLEKGVEHKKEVKDSHVDLQLSVIREEEGLEGDALKMDIIKGLLTASTKTKETKGLSLYSSTGKLSAAIRQGKTTLLPGLMGFNSIRKDYSWAGVFAKLGVYFTLVKNSTSLFTENELSKEGKEITEALAKGRLLLMIKGLNHEQAKVLLTEAKKPMVLLCSEVPKKDILDLIKKKKSALGLIIGKETNASQYFTQLDKVKKEIGTEHLIMINEHCLWKKEGKEQMQDVITDIIKSKYDRTDFRNIFSGTFLRVLDSVRGENTR